MCLLLLLAVYGLAMGGTCTLPSSNSSVPSPARNLTSTPQHGLLVLQWMAPECPNGNVSYVVTVTRFEQTVKQDTTQALNLTVRGLGQSRRYTVTVVPRNSFGSGNSTEGIFWTDIEILPLPITQDPIESMSTVVTIKLPGTAGDHDLTLKYYVFVLRSVNTLFTPEERRAATPQPYTGAADQQYYTAAVLDSFHFRFPLGDGRTTTNGGVTYTNVALQHGSTYYYFVQYRVTTPFEVVEVSEVSMQIVITNISPPPAAVDTALIIATVVVPLLLISSLHS